MEFIAPELWERYYETVLGERLATVPSDNLNLLYTPLCGTGNKPVRTVLGRIGVNVAVVPAQEKPDGDFKTCEYPNPETDAALNESYKIARETHPDLILGTDPDCDRVAVAVLVGGGFRKLSGNELGCLLLDYILGYDAEGGHAPGRPRRRAQHRLDPDGRQDRRKLRREDAQGPHGLQVHRRRDPRP